LGGEGLWKALERKKGTKYTYLVPLQWRAEREHNLDIKKTTLIKKIEIPCQ